MNGHDTALMMPVRITLTDPGDVDATWMLAAPYLIEGMLACGEDLDEAYTIGAIRRGEVQLWLVHQGHFVVAALTTRFWPSCGGKVCHMAVGGGTGIADWFHLGKTVEEYAKANGCTKMRVAGRNGWERKLTTYRRVGVILEREF